MTEMKKERVGFVGAGLMGHGMAKHILKGGWPLTVVAHKNRGPIEDLVQQGAREAGSVAELARESDIVFLCVTASPQGGGAHPRVRGDFGKRAKGNHRCRRHHIRSRIHAAGQSENCAKGESFSRTRRFRGRPRRPRRVNW